MRTIKTTLTVLLAIIWLPVSSHCLLVESVAAFEFLACCTHSDQAEPAEHHEADCATDVCSDIETAKYKSSVSRIDVPARETRICFAPPPLLEAHPLSTTVDPCPAHTDHSKLLVTWQFSSRTALPARAPSLVS